ncbi:coiled-coil domain-containing protein [Mycolicibacterium aichiense]|uniref:coiled-coil domain-containing protein n=1 Tax=Mycolicibacterium aichiense TaxID=1799 RepID=UPI0013D352EF|nr:hypothetical protein [Mycolicibacterium aichiense]
MDELAKLNELTKQAQELIETAQSVQLDLDRKLQLQSAAEQKHTDDVAALESTRAQLADYQGTVDRAAAAIYTGGSTDSVTAFFAAASPQRLIDQLAVQRTITDQITGQLQKFREAQRQAAVAAAASGIRRHRQSGRRRRRDVRADLETKQSEVEGQVRLVRATYALPAAQQALLGPGAIPTVGMSGLTPTPEPSRPTSSRPSGCAVHRWRAPGPDSRSSERPCHRHHDRLGHGAGRCDQRRRAKPG